MHKLNVLVAGSTGYIGVQLNQNYYPNINNIKLNIYVEILCWKKNFLF